MESKEQQIAQRNKEISEKEQEIDIKKKTATQQEMRKLERELDTLKYVGNPSMTLEETLKQFQEYALIQKRKRNMAQQQQHSKKSI